VTRMARSRTPPSGRTGRMTLTPAADPTARAHPLDGRPLGQPCCLTPAPAHGPPACHRADTGESGR
jgi:hypothetical protein